MTITCGIDWAENHHDVALVDEAGKLIAKRRRSTGLTRSPKRRQAHRRILQRQNIGKILLIP